MFVLSTEPAPIVPGSMIPVAIVKTHVIVIEEEQVLKTKNNICAYSAVKHEVNAMIMTITVTMGWGVGRR